MAKFDPDGSGKSTPRARRSEGATRSRQTHDAILAAALEILEERGYAGFTVEAVASRARAGKPTIYKWWKSKGALLAEINDHLFAPLFQLPERGSAEAELEEYLIIGWSIARAHPNAVRGAFADAQLDADSALHLRERFLARRRTLVRSILTRGVARKQLSKRLDVELAADMFLAYSVFKILTNETVAKRQTGEFVRILVRGFRQAI